MSKNGLKNGFLFSSFSYFFYDTSKTTVKKIEKIFNKIIQYIIFEVLQINIGSKYWSALFFDILYQFMIIEYLDLTSLIRYDDDLNIKSINICGK